MFHVYLDVTKYCVLSKIKEYLETLCKDEFQKHYLEDAMKWAEETILAWLKLITEENDGKSYMERLFEIFATENFGLGALQ